MTIEEARRDQIRCECQGFRLSALISKYDAVQYTISELDKINQCGSMVFIGRSGKIREDNIIVQISINAIGGCVSVPKFLRGCAEEQLRDVEEELAKL